MASMKKWWIRGLLVVSLLFSLLFNVFFILKNKTTVLNSSPTDLFDDEVIRVIDGDTFDTKKGERIRLYEIDTPEFPTQCLGKEAKVRLVTLIDQKNISYKSMGKDNFGRTLAYVYSEKKLVNTALVEEGLAYYRKGKTITANSLIIEKAQDNAKSLSRGVWSTLCQSQKSDCLIKGNYREDNHTRIYHLPSCYNYDKISIKDGTSDRWFCTEKEASEAGFIKSQDCPIK